MSKFLLSYYTVICEAVNRSKDIKLLQTNLNKILKTLEDASYQPEDKEKWEELKETYEKELVLRTVPVKVTCYDKTEEYPCALDAIEYFEEGLSYCDPQSSEAERYETVIDRLLDGQTEVTDSYWG
jgi:hypothetical protein